MKCRKHKIKKTIDLGGVLFCKKCLHEGLERFENSGLIKEDEEKETLWMRISDYLGLRPGNL